ncbi:MAG: hypothetical protein Q7T20_07625 [Saprospiraceae bacterium]|nr:hypothetical protein [Saprospiraceae bacterium]
MENLNLIERGLCWRKDIREDSAFRELVYTVTKRFGALNGKN